MTATEAKKKSAVISRELRWAGGVVELKMTGKGTVIESENVEEPYLAIQYGVKGGVVFVFLYGDDIKNFAQTAGRVVRCSIELHKKTYNDGRQVLYLNARIVPDTTLVTHELVIRRKNGIGKLNTVHFEPVPNTEGSVEIFKMVTIKKR